MAKFIFSINISLDGYVNHDAFAPGPLLFRHFVQQVRHSSGGLYGRKIYQLMQYWDEDQAAWGDDEHDFAKAWRVIPKWVVSTTFKSVGANTTLVNSNIEAELRQLKATHSGTIDIGGPNLAHSLSQWGLIDEYNLYYRPFVLGKGIPAFPNAMSKLRLKASEMIGEDTVRLRMFPA